MIDFKFNGTESFGVFFAKVKGAVIKDSSIIQKENGFIVNVAGFAKDEVKVRFNRTTGEITVICNGDSPIYGKEYAVSFDLGAGEIPNIEYVNGALIIKWDDAREPDEVELSFEDTRLLD